MKEKMKDKNNLTLYLILGLVAGGFLITLGILFFFIREHVYFIRESWDYGFGIVPYTCIIVGIVLIIVFLITLPRNYERRKKLAAMSQSDVSEIFACPECGNIGAIYLIKLAKDQILVKHKCPIHGGRLLRLPLRLLDHCISHFRDNVFRCFKCGQETTVDHVKSSRPWTLIKLSCPTHGNRLPYHKIWTTVYNEISKEGVAAPQPAQPQPIPRENITFCPTCGEKLTGADQTVCQNCGSTID